MTTFFLQPQELIILPWGLSGVQSVKQSNMPQEAPIYTLCRCQLFIEALNYFGVYIAPI